MLSCPKCGSEVDEHNGKYVCSNEECDFSVKKENLDEKKADFEKILGRWYEMGNGSLTHKKACT